MPSGSCFCGAVKFSFTGEPLMQALCHCNDCRKLSGSVYSTNLLVPAAGFTIDAGTPKGTPKTSDAGNQIVNYFCGECGSPLWGEGGFSDSKVVRAGVLDGEAALENAKPALELYAERRVGWIKGCEGVPSVEGMGKGPKKEE